MSYFSRFPCSAIVGLVCLTMLSFELLRNDRYIKTVHLGINTGEGPMHAIGRYHTSRQIEQNACSDTVTLPARNQSRCYWFRFWVQPLSQRGCHISTLAFQQNQFLQSALHQKNTLVTHTQIANCIVSLVKCFIQTTLPEALHNENFFGDFFRNDTFWCSRL